MTENPKLMATSELSRPPVPPATAPLAQAGLRAEFREMIQELVHCRELLWQMVLRDIRIRYKQAVFGFAWAIFMPVMVVGAGLLVKFAMAHMSGGPLQGSSIAGMTIKAIGWSFFVGSINFAVGTLLNNMSLVTKIYFPREVFPFSAVLTQLFDTLVGSSVMAVLLFLVLRVGVAWSTLWVFPLALILFLLTAGLAMFLSSVNVFFRDVKYLVQVILMFGIFFTPVFFEPFLLGPTGGLLMMLNPLAPVLEGMRLAVVEHHNLLTPLSITLHETSLVVWQPWYLLYAGVWGVFGFLGAWWMFHRLEFIYPEYV